MVMGEKIGREDRFSGEKLSPVLTVWKWTDFDEMLDRMEKILKFSGEGHSVNIQTELDERMREDRASRERQPRRLQHGPYGGQQRRLDEPVWAFTDTLGCGTWAGNISCENINWKQFLMYTLMSRARQGLPAEKRRGALRRLSEEVGPGLKNGASGRDPDPR